jgi:hypothetical protein
MRRREGTKLLLRLFKRFRIWVAACALMLIAAPVPVSGGAGTILAEVALAGEIVNAEVVDTLHMIDAEFALSEPVYRGTDRGHAILILTLVFSGIVALNFWFFRHLHRVYGALR